MLQTLDTQCVSRNHQSMTHRELQEHWGARVRAARTAQGLTLLELCRRSENIDPGNLSRLERGLQYPSETFRAAVADALGMRVPDLFSYPADVTRT